MATEHTTVLARVHTRADGRTGGRAVYGHVITKFSGMGRFTYPWCSAGALCAPELRYNMIYFCVSIFVITLQIKKTKIFPTPKV